MSASFLSVAVEKSKGFVSKFRAFSLFPEFPKFSWMMWFGMHLYCMLGTQSILPI